MGTGTDALRRRGEPDLINPCLVNFSSRHFLTKFDRRALVRSPKMESAQHKSDQTACSSKVTVREAQKPLPKPRGAAAHMCIDKTSDKRVRISEEQKAQTVQQFMKNPSMTYAELGEWCKGQFKLEKAPSNGVICQWLKPEKRKELLEWLQKETCSAKLTAKSKKQAEHPEMEADLFEWFRKHEQRRSVITDCVIQMKAKEICQKRKIEFKASPHWVRNFKARHNIGLKVLHGEAGSADQQWVSVARAVCLHC